MLNFSYSLYIFILGKYFKKYPRQIESTTKRWVKSGNIWLQRSALLFQLKYKDEMDTDLLEELIPQLSGTKEFFLNKAIGWILRQYGRFNPEWVRDFLNKHELANLSVREASKYI